MVELLSNRYCDTNEDNVQRFIELHNELSLLEQQASKLRLIDLCAGSSLYKHLSDTITQCCLAICRLRPRIHRYARQQLQQGQQQARMKRLLLL